MGDGLRTVHLITADESLMASVRGAVGGLEGWEFVHLRGAEAVLETPPATGDVLLLDHRSKEGNVYEVCRSLTGTTRCRTFVIAEEDRQVAEPIARFCGATGALSRPLTTAALRTALEHAGGPMPALPSSRRGSESDPDFPEALLRDLQGQPDTRLVDVLTDPETGLFNFAFLNYKLEEEFRRAARFGQPLSCVMLGFEGQASELVLRELASIFLVASRDTDVLGRFDENAFLFLLPNTGLDGARVMAQRVGEMAQERNLRDLVGDPLQISVGIAFHPHPDIGQREDLFSAARQAFFDARHEGGGVVCAT